MIKHEDLPHTDFSDVSMGEKAAEFLLFDMGK